jgi:hypothetical protein
MKQVLQRGLYVEEEEEAAWLHGKMKPPPGRCDERQESESTNYSQSIDQLESIMSIQMFLNIPSRFY